MENSDHEFEPEVSCSLSSSPSSSLRSLVSILTFFRWILRNFSLFVILTFSLPSSLHHLLSHPRHSQLWKQCFLAHLRLNPSSVYDLYDALSQKGYPLTLQFRNILLASSSCVPSLHLLHSSSPPPLSHSSPGQLRSLRGICRPLRRSLVLTWTNIRSLPCLS